MHQYAHAIAHLSRVSAWPWYALNVSCRSSSSLKQPRLGCKLHGGVGAGAGGRNCSRGMAPCTEPVSSGLSSQQQQVHEQLPFYAVEGLNYVDGVRTEQIAVARGSLCRKASQARLLSSRPLALHDLHRQRARGRAHACVRHPPRGSGISGHRCDRRGRQDFAAAVRSIRCAPASS